MVGHYPLYCDGFGVSKTVSVAYAIAKMLELKLGTLDWISICNRCNRLDPGPIPKKLTELLLRAFLCNLAGLQVSYCMFEYRPTHYV